jgi:hypothetical protein
MKRTANYLLLVFLILCGLSLWLGRGESPDEAAPANEEPAEATIPDAGPVLALERGEDETGDSPVHLVILNGTEQAGLARKVGLALGVAGCVTQRVDNAPHTHFEQSLLINRRLTPSAARSLAARLGGVPLLLERDPRTTEDAVLVLGADYLRVWRALDIHPTSVP